MTIIQKDGETVKYGSAVFDNGIGSFQLHNRIVANGCMLEDPVRSDPRSRLLWVGQYLNMLMESLVAIRAAHT